MNERLKEVRASSGLNTRDFSARLGMSAGAISLLETGKRNMTSQFITSLCREFNINEEWLRTGEGKMFPPKDRIEEIADITAELMKNESMKAKFIKAISNLSEEQLLNLYEIGKQIIEDVEKQKDQH